MGRRPGACLARLPTHLSGGKGDLDRGGRHGAEVAWRHCFVQRASEVVDGGAQQTPGPGLRWPCPEGFVAVTDSFCWGSRHAVLCFLLHFIDFFSCILVSCYTILLTREILRHGSLSKELLLQFLQGWSTVALSIMRKPTKVIRDRLEMVSTYLPCPFFVFLFSLPLVLSLHHPYPEQYWRNGCHRRRHRYTRAQLGLERCHTVREI